MNASAPINTTPQLGIRPGSLGAWLLASRPKTLSAAAVPVLVGTACASARGQVQWAPALAALLGALLLQIGANFANDVFDFEKGADTAERLGPTRAVQAGLISARSMRRGMLLVFGLALAIGLYLTYLSGPVILLIGCASIASAIAYTGGPYPLGYHGLGDLFVFIFFGLVAVCGTAFVEIGRVPALALWCAIPVGALATAILVVNNLRDRVTDLGAGKRTLAVRYGRGFALGQYRSLLAVSYLTAIGLAVTSSTGPEILLTLLSLPLALKTERAVTASEGRALNPLLAATAKLLAVFGILFALGLSLRGMLSYFGLASGL
ncbi:MAG TPA: 1,4-dihydroxy-2-naphthoate polyprenyltransferase [Polyangiaceae bacterium]|nr:1,4-dihydroxy-2-naphthoate polyprenyltransferase [Polyangiaceae bacterium]